MTHLIYLSIIAALVGWLVYSESQVRRWYSKWHSERSNMEETEND